MMTVMISCLGGCPNRPKDFSDFVYEINGDWFRLVETTCSKVLGTAFGKMCPCWRDYDPALTPEAGLYVLDRQRGCADLWRQARYAVESGLVLKDCFLKERYKAACVSILLRAYKMEQLDESTLVELVRKVGPVQGYFGTQTELFEIANSLAIDLKPIAFVFADQRLRAIAARDGHRQAIQQFKDWELSNQPFIEALKYIARFDITAFEKVMSWLETKLDRITYGRVCQKVGWFMPDLTREEQQKRENYLAFKRWEPYFANASTDAQYQFMIGKLTFEVELLPNQEWGGTFYLEGRKINPEAVVDYIREYAQQLANAVLDQ